MNGANDILDRLVLVGGPPRGGTTFAARSLNFHPRIVTAIDDHVYECWGLYYYRTRVGLVQHLRTRQLPPVEVRDTLKDHLFEGNCLRGVAPSDKTSGCPPSPLPPRPDSSPTPMDLNLTRHTFPLERFGKDWFLCLKSPEISYVLPRLTATLPTARFVLVYRPIIEIAESMYRKGLTVKLPIFHKRWAREADNSGNLIPPPGIPGEWCDLWRRCTDFQRCVISAASYTRALVEGVPGMPPGRVLVYNHLQLRRRPAEVFSGLADFLGVDPTGFDRAMVELNQTVPEIGLDLEGEYREIASPLHLEILTAGIRSLDFNDRLF